MSMLRIAGAFGLAAFAMTHLSAQQSIGTIALGACEGPPVACVASVHDAQSLQDFVFYRLNEVKAELTARKNDR